MTTVMTWGNSEGVQGRCDAKCHNATEDDCDCMCGGRYHGASHHRGGLEAAVRRHSEEVLEGAKARAKAAGVEITVSSVAELFGQGQLFR